MAVQRGGERGNSTAKAECVSVVKVRICVFVLFVVDVLHGILIDILRNIL